MIAKAIIANSRVFMGRARTAAAAKALLKRNAPAPLINGFDDRLIQSNEVSLDVRSSNEEEKS